MRCGASRAHPPHDRTVRSDNGPPAIAGGPFVLPFALSFDRDQNVIWSPLVKRRSTSENPGCGRLSYRMT